MPRYACETPCGAGAQTISFVQGAGVPTSVEGAPLATGSLDIQEVVPACWCPDSVPFHLCGQVPPPPPRCAPGAVDHGYSTGELSRRCQCEQGARNGSGRWCASPATCYLTLFASQVPAAPPAWQSCPYCQGLVGSEGSVAETARDSSGHCVTQCPCRAIGACV